MAIKNNFPEFCNLFKSLDPNVGLGAFYMAMYDRLCLNPAQQKNVLARLASQRDQLRLFLHANKLIDHIDQPESAVVSGIYFYSM